MIVPLEAPKPAHKPEEAEGIFGGPRVSGKPS